MPSSAANQSARAFSIVSEISARSCAGLNRRRQIGAIDRKMQHVEFERLPQAVGGKVAGRVMSAGDPRQQPRQHREFAGQQAFEHPALGVLQDRFQPGRRLLICRQTSSSGPRPCLQSARVMAFSHS